MTLVLPEGSRILRQDASSGPPVNKERGWFELLTFPLAASSLLPLIYNIYLGAGTYLGVGVEVGLGLAFSILALGAGAAFFATLKTEEGKVRASFRWPVLFALPVVLHLIHSIVVAARGQGEEPRRTQLFLVSFLQLFLALVFVGAYAAWLRIGVHAIRDVIDEKEGVETGKSVGIFLLTAFGWLSLLALIWSLLPLLLPRRNPRLPFVSERNHLLALFDDATLFVDPRLDNSTAADQHFPTRRRPLLRIWWSGGGTLFVRSRRDMLEFSFSADGSSGIQQVMAPLAPMNAAELANFLSRAVQDNSGGFSNELRAQRADEDPLDYPLGPGLAFADFGDEEEEQVEHDAEAALFREIPATEEEALVLHHAPRERRTVRFGRQGPLVVSERATADGIGTIGPGASSIDVLGTGTRFFSFFRPGDLVEIRSISQGEARVVVEVVDDTHLRVNVAFPTALAAGTDYRRRIPQRELDVLGEGTIGPHTTFRDLRGAGTAFGRFFMPGDVIRARPVDSEHEERRVIEVLAIDRLRLDASFSPAVEAGTTYQRVGRLSEEGVAFVPEDPSALFAGDSVMDRAADLATLLCLGATSHLVPEGDLAASTTGTVEEQHPAIDKVHQVFRNWNLDLRRVNEWKMLVGGDAVSEKRGEPGKPDPLQPLSTEPLARTPAGEAASNRLGWVRTLTHWLDAARRPGMDMTEEQALRPGDPTRLELSRALSYLLDMPDPKP